MRIALDALGGDHGPSVTVHGAYLYLQNNPDDSVVLVGARDQIEEELEKIPSSYHSRLPICHAPENIDMHESPTEALRKKKNSSMVQGLTLHKNGEVDAFVSAGSTGAQMAASLLVLGRISSVKRPAIGAFLPSEKGLVFVIDVGANVDSKPVHLFQFATMANIFVSYAFKTDEVGQHTHKVGLLSIGEEDSKGNEVTVATNKLLKEKLPNFHGNVEGGDIFRGTVDIIVCDGFVGNILLKMAESVMSVLLNGVKKNIGKNLIKNFGAILVKPAITALKQNFSYEEYGGVPLLGVNGISIICHGKSSSLALKNALRVARNMYDKKINDQIEEKLKTEEELNAKAG